MTVIKRRFAHQGLVISRNPWNHLRAAEDYKSKVRITIPPSTETQVVVVTLSEIVTTWKARIGFAAPKGIIVDREEIALEKDREAELEQRKDAN